MNYQSSRARAGAVATAIRQSGGTAVAVQADVGDKAAVVRLLGTTDCELDTIDALVAKAGGFFDYRSAFLELKPEAWNDMRRVDAGFGPGVSPGAANALK
ncbi:MAG: SDR family NAD(P)-dependent oxidoreductase [Betaproteobacteria bacterium]|nr:SDR family NAD(P)-dependent oxidoreductase [Betaproteobacteria bacterium]